MPAYIPGVWGGQGAYGAVRGGGDQTKLRGEMNGRPIKSVSEKVWAFQLSSFEVTTLWHLNNVLKKGPQNLISFMLIQKGIDRDAEVKMATGNRVVAVQFDGKEYRLYQKKLYERDL